MNQKTNCKDWEDFIVIITLNLNINLIFTRL